MIFTYYLTVDHVHDGDTIYGDLDLGLGIHLTYTGIRLNGINAPELSQPGGREARDYLKQYVTPGTLLRIESLHWDKYAMRIDANAYTPNNTNLGEIMLTTGHATPYNP